MRASMLADPDRARRAHQIRNPRNLILNVARRILEEGGREALNLRAISLEAKVSLGTIYHYYDSKHALLAGLAVEGFDELTRRMLRAFNTRGDETGLRATGYAYIDFLRERPALYQVMFDAVDRGEQPQVLEAEIRAFRVLADSIPFAPGAQIISSATAEDMAQAMWAWGRGIAAVGFSRGGRSRPPETLTVESALNGLHAIFEWRTPEVPRSGLQRN